MFLLTNNLSWMIGGAQGSGVDSAANIFGRACAIGGLEVFGKREFHSNIKGLHSYFHINVNSNKVRSISDSVNLLATFDEETLVRHSEEVILGGGIIYDEDQEATKISSLRSLDSEVKTKTLSRLGDNKYDYTVNNILEESKDRGIHLFPIPYTKLLTQVSKETDTKLSELSRILNILAVAVSFAILNYDEKFLNNSIIKMFESRSKIIKINLLGAKLAYKYVNDTFSKNFDFNIKSQKNTDRLLLNGNEAIALGKISGGCRFQSYYPITPAADESTYLEAHSIFKTKSKDQNESETGSIVVIQTEDELAALTCATGAAMTGTRAATSTSGPGFSVMVEGIGWAGINEVPVVITLYQRGGPSTGLPTRHEQGDIQFALYAGHGEFPCIIVASGDIEECFYDAIRVFNYAEKYQTPAIHLIDKALANSNMTLDIPNINQIQIERGLIYTKSDLEKLSDDGDEYKRFLLTDSGISPRISLGTKGGIFWATGDEHNQVGHISEDPDNRIKMMNKRMRKLTTAVKEIPIEEKICYFGDLKAKYKVISWGSTKGAILDALDRFKREGIEIGFLQIRLINPLAVDEVTRILEDAENIINIEMNYSSQMANIITEKTGIKVDNRIVKYNGRPISKDEVYYSIKNFIDGKASKRQVLTNGA